MVKGVVQGAFDSGHSYSYVVKTYMYLRIEQPGSRGPSRSQRRWTVPTAVFLSSHGAKAVDVFPNLWSLLQTAFLTLLCNQEEPVQHPLSCLRSPPLPPPPATHTALLSRRPSVSEANYIFPEEKKCILRDTGSLRL